MNKRNFLITMFVSFALLFVLSEQIVFSGTNFTIEPVIKDTCSNSMHKVGYVHFEKGRIVDSVQFVMYAAGEIDIDRFIATKSFEWDLYAGNSTTKDYSTAVGDSTTLTTDNAAATSTVEYIVTWGISKFRGCTSIKCQIDSGSSGNDATDPNSLQLYALVYYRPE